MKRRLLAYCIITRFCYAVGFERVEKMLPREVTHTTILTCKCQNRNEIQSKLAPMVFELITH